MKPGVVWVAVGASALLLFGCTGKKRIAELEATNEVLRSEIEQLQSQVQAREADQTRINDLLRARRELQVKVQAMYLQNLSLQSAASNKASAAKPVAKKSAKR